MHDITKQYGQQKLYTVFEKFLNIVYIFKYKCLLHIQVDLHFRHVYLPNVFGRQKMINELAGQIVKHFQTYGYSSKFWTFFLT